MFNRPHVCTKMQKHNLERLSMRTPCWVSVSLESILMLNSLSTSKTKEIAPESGFMYSKNESLITSQLQNTRLVVSIVITTSRVCIYCCGSPPTLEEALLSLLVLREGCGKKNHQHVSGCRWLGRALPVCGIFEWICCL